MTWGEKGSKILISGMKYLFHGPHEFEFYMTFKFDASVEFKVVFINCLILPVSIYPFVCPSLLTLIWSPTIITVRNGV